MVTVPQLAATQQQQAAAHAARCAMMVQLYQWHHGEGAVAEAANDLEHSEMLQWCSDLQVDDYLQCGFASWVQCMFGICR